LNENVKIVFREHLPQKWIGLGESNTKTINDRFYACRRIHFTSELMLLFCEICLSRTAAFRCGRHTCFTCDLAFNGCTKLHWGP